MEHELTIKVSDEVYGPLVEAAMKEGRTPEEEAALRLKRSTNANLAVRTPRDRQQSGRLEDLFGSVSLGHPTDLDNESIDRDLALEYAATHEDAE
jgi:hypothetical protein